MSTSISGLIEFTEQLAREGADPWVECFCAFPSLGNSSLLGALLRERREPLPERLSYEAIGQLTIVVRSDQTPASLASSMASNEEAEEWVEQGRSSWLEIDGQELTVTDQPTALVSCPDRWRGAGVFTLQALEEIQAEYRRQNIDEEEMVAVAPGEPLPEHVTGFAGTDERGRAQLYVATEEGPEHPTLAWVIACMKTAAEMVESEPRFIGILS